MSNLRTIVLIGPMGSGKTTVGEQISERLGRAFFDSDDVIQRATGLTAAEIAERHGVPRLHALETAVLNRALERSRGAVIAAAASVVDQPATVERLRGGREFVALLTASHEVCEKRASTGAHRRNLTAEERYELFERRLHAFRRAADVQVDTTSLDAAEVSELVMNAIWVSWP